MSSITEKSCSLLVFNEKPATFNEIKEALEGSDAEAKLTAMKKAVMAILNGEQLPQLFITIVRYVLPSEDHAVQKLLLLYLASDRRRFAWHARVGADVPSDVCRRHWRRQTALENCSLRWCDIIPIFPSFHSLKACASFSQILICQNLRNNLQHPNEYLRGVTLRFLCRIREEEILEPLIPSILSNLEHRHSYVRRSAVLAVNAIYKLPKGEMLLQDAPDTIDKVLRSEQDMSTKRNAFAMLSTHAQDKAVRYLFENVEAIPTWADILQMAILELIRKVGEGGMHAWVAMLCPCDTQTHG